MGPIFYNDVGNAIAHVILVNCREIGMDGFTQLD